MVGNKCKSSNNYTNKTNSCKYKQTMKQLHIFFYVQIVWCKCFQGMLPINLSLKRVGRVRLVNKCHWDVIKKTTMFTITKMLVQMFLHAWYALRMLIRVRSVIIPPIAKSANCLTYMLFSTFVIYIYSSGVQYLFSNPKQKTNINTNIQKYKSIQTHHHSSLFLKYLKAVYCDNNILWLINYCY